MGFLAIALALNIATSGNKTTQGELKGAVVAKGTWITKAAVVIHPMTIPNFTHAETQSVVVAVSSPDGPIHVPLATSQLPEEYKFDQPYAATIISSQRGTTIADLKSLENGSTLTPIATHNGFIIPRGFHPDYNPNTRTIGN